jgi:hypothetical protein
MANLYLYDNLVFSNPDSSKATKSASLVVIAPWQSHGTLWGPPEVKANGPAAK